MLYAKACDALLLLIVCLPLALEGEGSTHLSRLTAETSLAGGIYGCWAAVLINTTRETNTTTSQSMFPCSSSVDYSKQMLLVVVSDHLIRV